jgi:hemolysin D
MKAAKPVAVLPRQILRRRDHELAFLPAALEIVETPPSPLGRAIALTIVTLFSLALIWACLGSIDIIATAPGKIVTSGRSKIIQPFATGVVRAIHVQDGQRVKAGDLLIELDPTISDAEREHSRGDLLAAQLDVARLQAALSDNPDPLAEFHPPQGASPAMIATERQLLIDQIAEQRARLASLDRQKAEKEAEQATVTATMNKIASAIPLQEQRVEVRKYLFERGLGSKLFYLQEQQDLVGNQKEMLVQKSHYQEAQAALAALDEQRLAAVAQYRHQLSDDLAKAEAKAAGLAQDVISAGERTKLQRLTAPVDGVVQQLAVHTVGGVVTPAQPLLVVVPQESRLEIEAAVSNRDIGFIHEGQDADVKVDTFPYTRYGLLHGVVESVSSDAITPDAPTQGPAANPAGTGDANAKEPVYAARVSLDHGRMQIDDRLVSLTPGMAVTVEVKTGSRRIIGYLLSPLLRYGHDSLHER